MLDFIGRGTRTCDGVTPPQLPQGRLPGLGGLTLPGLLRLRAAGQAARTSRKSVILIWQAGGPSHIDMYDLKPNAPAEFRGEFKPIATNVPGIQISEHLPHQARIMDKLADRALGLSHQRRPRHGLAVDADRLPADHRSQRQHLSRRPAPWWRSCAAPTSRACRPTSTCRALLSLGKAAYLGASYNPFAPDSDPNERQLPGAQPEAARPRRRRRGSTAARELLERHRHASAATSTPAATSAGSTRSTATPWRWSPNTKAQQAFDVQQGTGQAARALRPQRPGPVLPAGPAAGRGGRDLRDDPGRRRLGHAQATTSRS